MQTRHQGYFKRTPARVQRTNGEGHHVHNNGKPEQTIAHNHVAPEVTFLLNEYGRRIITASHNIHLFSKIPLEQSGESLAVPGFVACHLVHGVVDGVHIQV